MFFVKIYIVEFLRMIFVLNHSAYRVSFKVLRLVLNTAFQQSILRTKDGVGMKLKQLITFETRTVYNRTSKSLFNQPTKCIWVNIDSAMSSKLYVNVFV